MPRRIGHLVLLSFAATTAWSAAAQDPIVIAHRGASGYLPEHTLEAYAMGYAMGADYIEPDLVLTKDGVFICLHDIHLEGTTDVEEKFPDRAREDGRWYAIDFSLAEIKRLQAHERIEEGRFPLNQSDFEVPTFEEMIELIQGLNAVTGRKVGIYPEIKSPQWHRAEGQPMEKALLDTLAQYGYASKESKVFVQSFEPASLQKIRGELKSKLKLVQLISDGDEHSRLRTEEGMKFIAGFADGIGPYKRDIVANPDLARWAKENGLTIHPYTFRADDVPGEYESFDEELSQFIHQFGVDGFFTDQPDKVAEFLK